MVNNKKVIVVLPAYNAAKTLKITYEEIDFSIVDEVILVDDRSKDETIQVARELGIRHIIEHPVNTGYGGNQKSCYRKALDLGADIVIMLHPDYQYTPLLIPSLTHLLASGLYEVALGSRILGKGALKGGMPVYKFIANRFLTFFQNVLMGAKLSEYHTGYRAFSKETLLKLPLLENSDDFIFDNQLLVQAVYFGCRIGEITAPSRYTKESSSIGFKRSVVYGTGVILTSLQFVLQKLGIARSKLFDENGGKLSL